MPACPAGPPLELAEKGGAAWGLGAEEEEEAAMPGHERNVAECIVVLALMSYDFGWNARLPTIAIPSFVLAAAMQLRLVARSRGEGVSFVNQLAMLFWLAGNIIWGLAELLWDDDRPAGWLAEVRWLQGGRQHYAPAMGVANLLMLPTMALLLGFYLVRWARVRSCEEPHVCLACLSMPVYEEIFIVPWIVMDSLWGLMDFLRLLRPDRQFHPLFGVSIAAGLVAISVQVDCLRRQALLRAWRDAATCLAELLWVAGNLTWLIMDYEDVVFAALCLFLLAAAVLVASSVPRPRCGRWGAREPPARRAAAAGSDVERGRQEAPADAPDGQLLVEVRRAPRGVARAAAGALSPGASGGLAAGGRSEPLVSPPSGPGDAAR